MSDTASPAWIDALHGEPAVFVTGVAGFIGFHVASRLLDAGVAVFGVDNLTPYYDVRLKKARLEMLTSRPGFRFALLDLADAAATRSAFEVERPRRIVHLAAQAGVRYSITNPCAYADSNLSGFLNVLEGCRAVDPAHLIYASSSSVYGGNRKLPFSVADRVDHPVSLYAATKKANELMAHAYCHLYGFPATGLRFFTVYGDWGRPDMAYWLFTDAISAGRPIDVYNEGRMARDFTHVDDVVEVVLRLLPRAPGPDLAFDRTNPTPGSSWASHKIYNIGNSRRERLMDLIAIIESAVGRKAKMRMLPMQQGDVEETWADISDLEAAIGYAPQTRIEDGLRRFVTWRESWRIAQEEALAGPGGGSSGGAAIGSRVD